MGKFSLAKDSEGTFQLPCLNQHYGFVPYINTNGETVFTWLQKTSVSVLHGSDEKLRFSVSVTVTALNNTIQLWLLSNLLIICLRMQCCSCIITAAALKPLLALFILPSLLSECLNASAVTETVPEPETAFCFSSEPWRTETEVV